MLLGVANIKKRQVSLGYLSFFIIIELNYLPSANTRSCSTAACPKMFK